MGKISYKLYLFLLIVGFSNCNNSVKGGKNILGEYKNFDGITITIVETFGYDQVEYVYRKLKVPRLGRYDKERRILTVYRSIHGDNIKFNLQFSEDYNLVYIEETGILSMIKKDYFDSLSQKEKEELKSTRIK